MRLEAELPPLELIFPLAGEVIPPPKRLFGQHCIHST
jgi:hypothetical protein